MVVEVTALETATKAAETARAALIAHDQQREVLADESRKCARKVRDLRAQIVIEQRRRK